MCEENTANATHAEIVQMARQHYERISIAQCDWSSSIGHALDAWEREPALKARCARMRVALERAQKRAARSIHGEACLCEDCKAIRTALEDSEGSK
jgi:hypothetical protein